MLTDTSAVQILIPKHPGDLHRAFIVFFLQFPLFRSLIQIAGEWEGKRLAVFSPGGLIYAIDDKHNLNSAPQLYFQQSSLLWFHMFLSADKPNPVLDGLRLLAPSRCSCVILPRSSCRHMCLNRKRPWSAGMIYSTRCFENELWVRSILTSLSFAICTFFPLPTSHQ